MENKVSTGTFITFEGIDASGKSTQVELLYDFLQKKGYDVLCLRDPGATPISEAIRHILLDKSNKAMSPWTELLLYEAARAQMVDESIKPALESGQIVLCDRFCDSTTAYQGYARGLDLLVVAQANQIGSVGLTPDLTFVIDIDPLVAAERLQKSSQPADRMEAEGLSFQSKVRQGYAEIARKESERVCLLDGMKSIEQIHADIIAKVQRVIGSDSL